MTPLYIALGVVILLGLIPYFVFTLLPRFATAPPWWFPRLLKNYLGRSVGFSGCMRCNDTWNWKLIHTTELGEGEGIFPLCEECWSGLVTPERRLIYYRMLIDGWKIQVDEVEAFHIEDVRWPKIKEAVEQGK